MRARRLDLGLTLVQAAQVMGTSAALVHEWEKKRKRPTAKWEPNFERFLGSDGPDEEGTSGSNFTPKDAVGSVGNQPSCVRLEKA
jgi:hypothetical protein